MYTYTEQGEKLLETPPSLSSLSSLSQENCKDLNQPNIARYEQENYVLIQYLSYSDSLREAMGQRLRASKQNFMCMANMLPSPSSPLVLLHCS